MKRRNRRMVEVDEDEADDEVEEEQGRETTMTSSNSGALPHAESRPPTNTRCVRSAQAEHCTFMAILSLARSMGAVRSVP